MANSSRDIEVLRFFSEEIRHEIRFLPNFWIKGDFLMDIPPWTHEPSAIALSHAVKNQDLVFGAWIHDTLHNAIRQVSRLKDQGNQRRHRAGL